MPRVRRLNEGVQVEREGLAGEESAGGAVVERDLIHVGGRGGAAVDHVVHRVDVVLHVEVTDADVRRGARGAVHVLDDIVHAGAAEGVTADDVQAGLGAALAGLVDGDQRILAADFFLRLEAQDGQGARLAAVEAHDRGGVGVAAQAVHHGHAAEVVEVESVAAGAVGGDVGDV